MQVLQTVPVILYFIFKLLIQSIRTLNQGIQNNDVRKNENGKKIL